MHELYKYLNERVKAQDNKLQTFVSNNESAQLLKTTSGVGDTKTSNDRGYGGMLYCPLLGTVLLQPWAFGSPYCPKICQGISNGIKNR